MRLIQKVLISNFQMLSRNRTNQRVGIKRQIKRRKVLIINIVIKGQNQKYFLDYYCENNAAIPIGQKQLKHKFIKGIEKYFIALYATSNGVVFFPSLCSNLSRFQFLHCLQHLTRAPYLLFSMLALLALHLGFLPFNSLGQDRYNENQKILSQHYLLTFLLNYLYICH